MSAKKNTISLFLGLILLLFCTTAKAVIKYSNTTGDWSTGSTWVGGVAPISTDTVVIQAGHTVILYTTATCQAVELNNGVLLNATLTIATGATLTVSGYLTNAITVGTLGGNSSVNIYGTLNVDGNFNLYSAVSVLSGISGVKVGNTLNPGYLNVGGDLQLINTFVSALGTVNQLDFYYGEINVDGNINMYSGGVSLLATNKITINDNGSYDGFYDKTINFSGSNIDLESGTIEVLDDNSNGDITFHYNGTSPQLIETTNITYKDVHIENTDYAYLDASPTPSNITGNLFIENNCTLLLSGANNLDALTGASDKIQILNGGRLKLTQGAFATGIPEGYITAEANGIVEFENNSGSAATIFLESMDYPIVQLTGADTKQYTSSSDEIDNSSNKVGRLEVLEGTLSIDNNLDLILNTSYGDGTLFVDSATTVQVKGNFSNLSAYGDFHRYSTFQYNKSGQMQDVYSFTTDGITDEPYGILELTTASGVNVKRDVDFDIYVENSLEIGGQITLNIKADAYVHLLSDANYTAYLKEVPNTGSITYNGSSAIVANKYMSFPGYSAPDISTAMQVQSLSMINNAGIQMRGFEGSNKPNNQFSSVSTYTESDTGNVNKGFYKPDDIDDLILLRNGSNKILKSAYRINVNPGSYTLKDTGEVNIHEQTFVLSFTHDNTTDNTYRTSADGYNLLGNPFPAPLNWNAVVNDPDNAAIFAGGVSPIIYIYKYFDRVSQEPGGSGGYGYYNPSTEEEYAQDSIIPAYQGFWVKAYDASGTAITYDLKIKESHKLNYEASLNYKSKGNTTARKGRKLDKGLIRFHKNGDTQKDEIFFHFFEDATIYYDTKFDIPRFGSPSNSRAFVDFADSTGMPLGLYVNAFDNALIGQEIPLYVNMPEAGNYTLNFLDIASFLNPYACITVVDTITGQTYTLSNNLEIPVSTDEAFNGVRFLIRFEKNNADLLQNIDASCFNAKDGKIVLPVNATKENHHYALWKDNFIVQEKMGNMDSLVFQNLKAGVYTLVNNNQLNACEVSNQEIVIEQPAKLLSYVSVSDQIIKKGESVAVSITGTAANYLTSIENKTYTATSFQHQFTKVGSFSIEIYAEDSSKHCQETQQYPITVEELTTNIGEKVGINYSIDQGFLFFQKRCTVSIYNTNGQLMQQYDNVLSIPIMQGTYLYQISEANNSVSLKIKR